MQRKIEKLYEDKSGNPAASCQPRNMPFNLDHAFFIKRCLDLRRGEGCSD
jgi:hypothetical protein